MNLIEESFQNKEEKKKKRTTGIILGAIIFLVLLIIGIASYLFYIESTTMRVLLDDRSNESLKQILVFGDDGTIYVPIKEIASYFGYDSYNGEYTQRSEDQSKCYVQNENEVANFSLNSNTIYKLDLTTGTDNYENVYVDEPVIARNGVLYATSEAIEKAFNVSFQYDQERNRIYIYTLPYLIQSYSSTILDYGYTAISEVFANQKAILQDMLVVTKGDNEDVFAVIKTDGTPVLEPKYDEITYLPETGDFKVSTNGKVGILGNNGSTKVQIMYDSIDLMDSDAKLYVAENDGKYGAIDFNGNVKIYIENDEIGMDISQFEQNNIKNKYILVGNLIPARKGELWGLYDKNGNLVVDYYYDSLGYIAKTSKDALNLLVIPDYNVLVACKDEKYTLLNSVGRQLFQGPVADDIYMTISGGQRHYYITANNQTMDAETYLKNIGVSKTNQSNTVNNSTNNNLSNNSNNVNTNSQNNQVNTEEQVQENNEEQNQDNNQQGEGQTQEGQQQVQEQQNQEQQGQEQQSQEQQNPEQINQEQQIQQ